MADLDSRSKRASSVGLMLAWLLAPVAPDGTLTAADRQHSVWSYNGIASSEAAPSGGALFYHHHT